MYADVGWLRRLVAPAAVMALVLLVSTSRSHTRSENVGAQAASSQPPLEIVDQVGGATNAVVAGPEHVFLGEGPRTKRALSRPTAAARSCRTA